MRILDKIMHGPEQPELTSFLQEFTEEKSAFYRREELIETFDAFCKRQDKPEAFRSNSLIRHLLDYLQEMVLFEGDAYLVTRRRIGVTEIQRIAPAGDRYENITVEEFLKVKEAIILGKKPSDLNGLVIDLDPFIRWPLIRDSRSIGKGIYFLLRHLSSQLFHNQQDFLTRLLDFLKVHTEDDMQLMLNPAVSSLDQLDEMLQDAVDFLLGQDPETPYEDLADRLKSMGFEPGWGHDAARILSTMELLNSILDNPDHEVVSEFFSRIPMVHRIAIITPHGWFAQENVLGRPDTGGQIVYILNQVKALENELIERIRLSGLDLEPQILIVTRLIPEAEDTRCNVAYEPVDGTKHTHILRVPFREHNKAVTDRWISRFDIWPYLEEFAHDAGLEVMNRFDGRPDLIVGNYSDGNLVAYLMGRDMDVAFVTIAHALEKAKYLGSDLNWKEMDDAYHFSLQFTADLLAMTAANITVTSTYQEIAGTEASIGQYESYRYYTLPDLYRVTSGANMFHPRYNIVPPGVDQDHFFPYWEKKRRDEALRQELTRYVFHGGDDATSRFRLADPDKKPIYSIARLDKIKNITGLAEAFGKSEALRKHCNLIVVAGHVDRADSTDREEQAQIDLMNGIVEKYGLQENMRWLEMETDKNKVGELYRLMADRGGVFVQPALFEAFGLTVLEGMISALPTVATRFGGPRESIEQGKSGFHLNPFDHGELERTLLPLMTGDGHEELWKSVAEGGVERVLAQYTWDLHARELIKLSKIYGFWNYVNREMTMPLNSYVDTLYQLLYRPMARKLLDLHCAQ